jgi:hypothetical protein
MILYTLLLFSNISGNPDHTLLWKDPAYYSSLQECERQGEKMETVGYSTSQCQEFRGYAYLPTPSSDRKK